MKERWFVNPELVKKRSNEQAAMHSPANSRMKWDIHELEEDYPILSQIISHMLLAYLASYPTNKAFHSSEEGGINSYSSLVKIYCYSFHLFQNIKVLR